MNKKYIEKMAVHFDFEDDNDFVDAVKMIISDTKKAIEKECIKKPVVTSDVHNPILTLSSVITAIKEAEIK